jgi:hypothetical protein
MTSNIEHDKTHVVDDRHIMILVPLYRGKIILKGVNPDPNAV